MWRNRSLILLASVEEDRLPDKVFFFFFFQCPCKMCVSVCLTKEIPAQRRQSTAGVWDAKGLGHHPERSLDHDPSLSVLPILDRAQNKKRLSQKRFSNSSAKHIRIHLTEGRRPSSSVIDGHTRHGQMASVWETTHQLRVLYNSRSNIKQFSRVSFYLTIAVEGTRLDYNPMIHRFFFLLVLAV